MNIPGVDGIVGNVGGFWEVGKRNPSAINRHFENCPVRMERLKEKDGKEWKTQAGFSINR
tara:strand:- start:578 stop:757 length:180 start_codon:yes stop_codon:yes gene_type:complete